MTKPDLGFGIIQVDLELGLKEILWHHDLVLISNTENFIRLNWEANKSDGVTFLEDLFRNSRKTFNTTNKFNIRIGSNFLDAYHVK